MTTASGSVAGKDPPVKPIPKVYTDTRQPTPVGQLFSCTGDAPWPLYQGLGKTGSCEGHGVYHRKPESKRAVRRLYLCPPTILIALNPVIITFAVG